MKTFTSNQISKSVYALLIALCFSTLSYAAAISAAQSGDWNATTTWVGEVVPGASDDVTITGFTVTVSDAQAAQSITVQTAASTIGKLIVLATGTLTASNATIPLIIKGGEVENAGSIGLTTTSITTGSCISFTATNASMLINSGKYSGLGTLNLNSSSAVSGSAISMSQNQTTGTSPNQVFYGAIFTVGGNYTFNIASARPIFGIGIGRHTIDGNGTISVGTSESPVSHGLIMITNDFGRLTVNPNVTLSIVSNMAVANRGPIYFHNIPNATLINKGTISINGSGTNAMGSIASGATGAATLINEGTINVAGSYTESAIGINGGATSSFNITNTGEFNITGSYPVLPALSTPHPTNSNLVFSNYENGVLNLNISNLGIATASVSRARIINSGGTLAGSAIINGAFEPSTGIIAPGGTGIGKITLGQLKAAGSNTNNLTGQCVMDINGNTAAGTDFDQIVFTQATVDVAGATLVALSSGYAPASGDNVALFSFMAHTGSFSSTTLPANWAVDYAPNNAINLIYSLTTAFANNADLKYNVYVVDNELYVVGAAAKNINIYSLEGRKVYSSVVASDKAVIPLQKGLYVVDLGRVRQKICVR